MNKLALQDHRCTCGKLLLKGIVLDGQIEIKCKKCGKINEFGKIVFNSDLCHYILVLDERGIFTYVSDSTFKILGYRPEELLGKHFTTINPTFPPNVDMRLMWAGIEKNNFPLDTCHKTKDGKILPITIFFKKYRLTDKDKESHLIASVMLKQKLQTDQPTEKSVNYFESLCDIYFGINVKGEINYINKRAEELCGYSVDEVTDKPIFDLLPPEEKKTAKEIYMNFSKEEQSYRYESHHIIDRVNRRNTCDMYFTPRFNYTGEFTGYHVLGWIH